LPPIFCALAITFWYYHLLGLPDAYVHGGYWAVATVVALSIWCVFDQAHPFCRYLAKLCRASARTAHRTAVRLNKAAVHLDHASKWLERLVDRLFGGNW
jgi:hypothetical protein